MPRGTARPAPIRPHTGTKTIFPTARTPAEARHSPALKPCAPETMSNCAAGPRDRPQYLTADENHENGVGAIEIGMKQREDPVPEDNRHKERRQCESEGEKTPLRAGSHGRPIADGRHGRRRDRATSPDAPPVRRSPQKQRELQRDPECRQRSLIEHQCREQDRKDRQRAAYRSQPRSAARPPGASAIPAGDPHPRPRIPLPARGAVAGGCTGQLRGWH